MGAMPARCARIAEALRPDVVIERYYNFGGEGIAAAARVGATAVLEVNAPVDRPSRVDQGAARSRAPRRADAAVARAPLRDRRSDRHAERGDPAGRRRRRRRSSSSSGAPTPIGFARAPPARSRSTRPAGTRRGLRRRVPQLARRDSPRDRHSRAATRAGATTSARCSSATGRSCRACARRPRGSTACVFTGALPHDVDARVPRGGRHRRRAVRRRRARAALARVLLVAAEDLRVHGRRAAGRRAGRRTDSGARRRTNAKGCCTPPAEPGALAAALERLTDARAARPARRRGPRARRPRLQLGGALPGARRGRSRRAHSRRATRTLER